MSRIHSRCIEEDLKLLAYHFAFPKEYLIQGPRSPTLAECPLSTCLLQGLAMTTGLQGAI